jgi:hypothetical protein
MQQEQSPDPAAFPLAGLGRLMDWLIEANDRLDAEEAAALVAPEVEVAS